MDFFFSSPEATIHQTTGILLIKGDTCKQVFHRSSRSQSSFCFSNVSLSQYVLYIQNGEKKKKKTPSQMDSINSFFNFNASSIFATVTSAFKAWYDKKKLEVGD